jgi:hypothetical protein
VPARPATLARSLAAQAELTVDFAGEIDEVVA